MQKKHNLAHLDEDFVFDTCLAYLKEECTVFMVFHRAIEQFETFLYPGELSEAIKRTFTELLARDNSVLMLRPVFTEAPAAQVQSFSKKGDDEIFERVDSAAQKLAERSNVLTSCLVIFIKRASSYTRDRLEQKIISKMMTDETNYTFHRIYDPKSTMLIFEPNNMQYSKDKFKNGKHEQYIPAEQVKYSHYSDVSIEKSCIIDARNLELPKKQQIFANLSLTKDPFHTKPLELREVLDSIEFIYAQLVYSGLAPDAKFFKRDNEGLITFYCTARSAASTFDRKMQDLKIFIETLIAPEVIGDTQKLDCKKDGLIDVFILLQPMTLLESLDKYYTSKKSEMEDKSSQGTGSLRSSPTNSVPNSASSSPARGKLSPRLSKVGTLDPQLMNFELVSASQDRPESVSPNSFLSPRNLPLAKGATKNLSPDNVTSFFDNKPGNSHQQESPVANTLLFQMNRQSPADISGYTNETQEEQELLSGSKEQNAITSHKPSRRIQ